jgi:hypothetical protein
MAGFGIALDPMKVELATTIDQLRAIDALQAQPASPPVRENGVPPVSANTVRPSASPAPAGASAPAGADAERSPQRPKLRPRVGDGAAGLAARTFQALNDEAARPLDAGIAAAYGPVQNGGSRVREAHGAAYAAEHAPAPEQPVRAPRAPEPDPWDDIPAQHGPRRVRLLDDERHASREPTAPDSRPFPAQPAEQPSIAAQSAGGHYYTAAAPSHVTHPGAARPAPGAYIMPARGGAAAALALPIEPPAARPELAARQPRLELAEVVATRGSTFCRVVITVDGEKYTGVAELPDLEHDRLQLVARITVDALRSARIPREPVQFHGAAATDIGGRTFVIAVLRAWNGRAFDDLTGVEPVDDSPEEAAALAVLRAAASRIA